MGGRLTLGCDPGTSGAVALLDETGDLIEVVDAPALKDGPAGRSKLNGPLLADIVRRWTPDQAFIETVGARPGEAPSFSFAFGRSAGIVDGVLAGLSVPTHHITPVLWRRAVGLPVGSDKDRSRAEAIRRWPAKAGLLARKKDNGRAEAALIAAAGLARAATSAPSGA